MSYNRDHDILADVSPEYAYVAVRDLTESDGRPAIVAETDTYEQAVRYGGSRARIYHRGWERVKEKDNAVRKLVARMERERAWAEWEKAEAAWAKNHGVTP